MRQETAETIAVQALAWLAEDRERFAGFLEATGAGVNEIRAQAADPAFLGAVLDFLLQDDARVRGFCDSAGLSCEAPMQARRSLPGGAEVSWT